MTSTTTTTGPGRYARPSPAVVHPRIRTRRIEVLRDAGRRRLRRALAGLSVLTTLVAIVALTQSPLLDIDTIQLRGGSRTSRRDLLAAAGIDRHDPMVGLDLRAAERRVEALPWVAEAAVTRRWPGTIEMAVRERVAAVAVPTGDGRVAEVDATGQVLALGGAAPEGLPAVEGVEGPLAAGADLTGEARDAVDVAVALDAGVPGAVLGVSTDLEATLAYGGTVRFGSTDGLDEKVVAVETVLAQVDLSCLDVLDVRAPGSPAITRHPGC